MAKAVLAFLRGCAAIALTTVILAIVASISPQVGIYAALLVLPLAVFTLVLPIRSLWIENKLTSIAIVAVALLAVGVCYKVIEDRAAAVQQEVLAKNEARLNLLRELDPIAYLAELKATSNPKWEAEFETLDKAGYALFVAERRAKQEKARLASIADLLEQSKKLPESDIDRLHQIYSQLASLDPKNKSFQTKRDALNKKIEEKRAVQAMWDDQVRNPERYVSIESFSWSVGGFDTVMIANFAIKNSLPWAVKDIEIQCTHSAPSGTVIDRNTRTIFERIEPKQTRRFSNFNMGFIHSQAKRSGCVVRSVVSLR